MKASLSIQYLLFPDMELVALFLLQDYITHHNKKGNNHCFVLYSCKLLMELVDRFLDIETGDNNNLVKNYSFCRCRNVLK